MPILKLIMYQWVIDFLGSEGDTFLHHIECFDPAWCKKTSSRDAV